MERCPELDSGSNTALEDPPFQDVPFPTMEKGVIIVMSITMCLFFFPKIRLLRNEVQSEVKSTLICPSPEKLDGTPEGLNPKNH